MAGSLLQVPQLELAVESAEDVHLAASVGAARVELCAALAETDGITASIATIEQACRVGLPVHVLVRPRPGSFTYSEEELQVLGRDVEAALDAGAAGVVVGVLTDDGGPDVASLLRVSEAARRRHPGAEVTFHRAFDAALAAGVDPAEALIRLERTGVNRVLTSGGSPDCTAGLPMLARLVELGREHAPSLQIMAGGGVRLELMSALVRSGVHAVHTSARNNDYSTGTRASAADPSLAAAMAAALAAGG
ncbi:copper homeostasis protein [Arthrobacter sp. V1I9]|jgi:copper homeostasis protein|uniref:copper homeostasis protein CutC n=1 Tax=Arthrobacter sp. V1I9 TaxID=3042275 RepID=UPI00278DB482|nr:copper homeostasis protein CutC [Arthrobacter sp. V1I9]MDQ0867728.1 copper homeostasis protein [Arthrobacter sp. V1I9]